MDVNALLRERIILLDGAITDDVANIVIAQMLFLDHENGTQPMHLRLRSLGGHVAPALAIRDTIESLSCPVHVHGLGRVGGMALVILAHGTRGARTVSPSGTLALTSIGAAKPTIVSQVERTESIIVEMLASDTGQARDTILTDMRAERTFTAEEGRGYGLVDRVAP